MCVDASIYFKYGTCQKITSYPFNKPTGGVCCQGHQPKAESSLLGIAHTLEKTHAQVVWWSGRWMDQPAPAPAHCNSKLQTIHKDQQRDMESEQMDMQAEGSWTAEEGVYFLASALTGGWDMVTKGVWQAETPMEGWLYSGPRKQRVKPGAIREMRNPGITQKRGDLNSVFEHCTRQIWVWSTAGYLRVTPRELEGQLRVVSIQGSWWRRWGFQSQSPKDPEGQPEICIATHHRWDRACHFNLIKSTAC